MVGAEPLDRLHHSVVDEEVLQVGSVLADQVDDLLRSTVYQTTYRVSHLLVHLALVDCKLTASHPLVGGPPSCPTAQPFLPNVHQPMQNWADSGELIIQVNPTKGHEYTACGHRIAYRKWKEVKRQPGTGGPGNMLGSCLVSFHFLWAILCTQAV